MLPLRGFAVRCILAAALAALSSACAVADAPYMYTSLGVDFRPYRISESGQVVGAAEFGRNPALLWRDGVLEILGPGAAQAINNAGDIVISAPRASDGYLTAHLRHDGTTTPLPIPPWGSDFRHFYDMNSSSHIVGQAQERAFRWADNQLMYLDGSFAGQSSSAYAINDAGKVVGLAGANGFLWDDGAVTLLPDTAMDINNRDQVLLFSAVWEGGTVTPIPLLPLLPGSSPEMTTMRAEAINDRGQVVARQRELYFIDVESGYGARDRSFLWDPVLGARDLADLVGQSPHDWTFAIVTDINSAGQIVGWGHNGGFLLTPVPEPASVTLIACAAIVLAGIVHRGGSRRTAGMGCARNNRSAASDVRSIPRTFTIVATIAIAFHLGALKAHAIEIVFGGNPGFNDSAIYYKDTDDPTSLASPIAGPLAGPIFTNGLAYSEGKIYARTRTGPMNVAEYEVNVDGTGFMPANSVPTRVGYAFQRVALTLDGSAGYYVDPQQDRIVRQDLVEFEPIDEATVVETDDFHPGLGDIALDERNSKIYWFGVLSPFEGGVIQRANFDGTDLETLVDTSDGINPDYAPVNLELDVARGKMYWSSIQGGIWRANLDGTNIEVVIPDVGFHGFALVIDPVPEPATWLLALGAFGALCCTRSRRPQLLCSDWHDVAQSRSWRHTFRGIWHGACLISSQMSFAAAALRKACRAYRRRPLIAGF